MLDLNYCETAYDLCDYSKKLLSKVNFLNRFAALNIDLITVRKAIYYAKKYHTNQKRQTGEPYYTHPLSVACMVMDYAFDTDTIVTSILHDVIEDTGISKEALAIIFGEKIANQVQDLSKIKMEYKITSEEMLNKLFNQNKYSLLLIKYFDRVHNIQSIRIKDKFKIQQITNETLGIFLDLGQYLNINYQQQNKLLNFCNLAVN